MAGTSHCQQLIAKCPENSAVAVRSEQNYRNTPAATTAESAVVRWSWMHVRDCRIAAALPLQDVRCTGSMLTLDRLSVSVCKHFGRSKTLSHAATRACCLFCASSCHLPHLRAVTPCTGSDLHCCCQQGRVTLLPLQLADFEVALCFSNIGKPIAFRNATRRIALDQR